MDSSAIDVVSTTGGQLDNDLYGADHIFAGDDVKSLNWVSDAVSKDPFPIRSRVYRLIPKSIMPKTSERKLASSI